MSLNNSRGTTLDPKRTLILDTETTGVDSSVDEIVQIAMIDGRGKKVMSQLIKPTHTRSWPEAQKIHGISPLKVAFKPAMSKVAPMVKDIMSKYDYIIGFNLEFDLGFLAAAGIHPNPGAITHDVMREWSHRNRNCKWPKLIELASLFGYDFNPHDALEDVRATLYCFKVMNPNAFKRTKIEALKDLAHITK